MTEPVVLHDRRDGYSVVTLNRPHRLNAFTEELHLALAAAIDSCAADDDCRALIITGAGRGFCAGQDLADRDPTLLGDSPDLGMTLETYYNPLVLKLRNLGKPVICAVNGVAAGAGANIALACDVVLAARSATFIQAFSRIGLIPDAGGTWWLTQRLGEARAKALALTGDPLPAEQAAEWGLIWKAVDDHALMKEAETLAARLAAGPSRAYALTKKAIQAASRNALEDQLAMERELQREAGRSDDYKEGVAAFLEKRPADYRRKAG